MFRIPTSILLLFGLVLATCVIAYWSDNLGKKLGKKRISLFGLRPRQTATLISMASSVGIMLFTLAALTIFSDQVRDAILRVDRLRDSNQQLRRTNEELASTSTALRKNVEESDRQAREAEKRAHRAREAANQAAERANKRVAAARAQIEKTDNLLASARRSLASAQKERAAAQRGQAIAKEGQRVAMLRAREARGELETARQILTQARRQYAEVQRTLAQKQRDLSGAQRSLKASLRANQQSLKTYQAQVRQLAAGQQEVASLQARLATLGQDIQVAEVQFNKLTRLAEQAVTGQFVVNLGQVFAEVVVPPRVEGEQLRKTLYRLLDAGSQAAIRLGGQPFVNPDTGIRRALHLATLNLPNGEGSINENDFIEHFAIYLSTINVPVSVRLVSVRRYVQDEREFQARLEAVPVNRIYAQGETVAAAVIDGAQRDTVIFNALIKLVNAGGEAARERGVTPLLSESVPEFFATGTNEQIFDTLRALQAQGKPMQVRMVAAEDIYSVDPMTIRFIVESDAD